MTSIRLSLNRWVSMGVLIALAIPSLGLFETARADESGLREGQFEAPDTAPLAATLQNADTSLAPGFYQTSEFMLGRVAVGVILPESDGTIDSNLSDWTAAQRQQVLDKVKRGLNWWSQLSPEAHLTFVIDDHASTPIATGYEPIGHPQNEEGMWIGDVLGKLGYADGSYWNRARTYVNDLRKTYDTDWAFAVFVVNSTGDADGAFADRYFAYAYVGGPFLVMTSDNAGYGIGNMDAITAHETGHIFRALDQYGAANVACTTRSGYLGVETQNGEHAGCASNVPSIMRGGISPYAANAIDPYARGQIGWRDSDGDGIYDPVDTIPTLTITASTQAGNVWSYAGRATDDPYPSTLRPAVTINEVVVEYSIDGGKWTLTQPADGAYDSPDEPFTLTLQLADSGNHHVGLRARTGANGVSGQVDFIAVVPDLVDGGLDTWLDAPASSRPGANAAHPLVGAATSFNADGTPGAAIARVEYRVDGGTWLTAQPQDGAFDTAEEAFTISLVQTGEHLLEARAIDANGKVEQNIASRHVVGGYQVFIPMVQK